METWAPWYRGPLAQSMAKGKGAGRLPAPSVGRKDRLTEQHHEGHEDTKKAGDLVNHARDGKKAEEQEKGDH